MNSRTLKVVFKNKISIEFKKTFFDLLLLDIEEIKNSIEYNEILNLKLRYHIYFCVKYDLLIDKNDYLDLLIYENNSLNLIYDNENFYFLTIYDFFDKIIKIYEHFKSLNIFSELISSNYNLIQNFINKANNYFDIEDIEKVFDKKIFI